MTETADYAAAGAAASHKTTHENGGNDEITVAELSGELAAEQKSAWSKVSGKPSTFAPSAHHEAHEDGGSDEIEIEAGASFLDVQIFS